MPSPLSQLEQQCLLACVECVQRQQELLPQLADTLGVVPEELFYSWQEAFRMVPPIGVDKPDLQVGTIPGADWGYFFHGFECDLQRLGDGRYLRVEFGPRGRIDIVDQYAVLQYVMTARPPWREFPELRAFLADKPPPYDQYSGSFSRASSLWDSLAAHGMFEAAAPDLHKQVEAATTISPTGQRSINLPNSLTHREWLDCLVSGRQVLTAAAGAII
ncbi:MAG: DUF6896 domain-containing protein [Actinomycetota bacterium]